VKKESVEISVARKKNRDAHLVKRVRIKKIENDGFIVSIFFGETLH